MTIDELKHVIALTYIIHTHIHTYMHACIHTYIHTYHVCIYIERGRESEFMYVCTYVMELRKLKNAREVSEATAVV